MRHRKSAILLLGLWAAFPVMFLTAEEDEEEVEWRNSFEEARKAAQLANAPIFIEFIRAGNKDCERMEKVLKDAKVAGEVLGQCIPVRLDADAMETRQMMNTYKISGTGMPYMVLFGLDMKITTEFGGYLSVEDFLGMFKAALVMAKQAPPRSPIQKFNDNQVKAEAARQKRLYGRSLELYREMIEIAQKLGAGKLVRETQSDMVEVDQYGEFEVDQVSKKLKQNQMKPEDAIAIAKRVLIEFQGRTPEAKAKAFLDELRKDPKLAELVEKTEAMPEGYERPIDAKSKTPDTKETPKPKTLTKITLNDGTVLLGTILARSDDQVYFKPKADEGSKSKAKFIKLADIETIEDVKE
jgi:thioredoxin-related protein